MHVREEDANGYIAGIRAPKYQEDLIQAIKDVQSESGTNNTFNSMALVILYSRLSDYASQIQLEGITRTSDIQAWLIASLKDGNHFKQGLLKAPADVSSDDPVAALTATTAAGVFSPRPPKSNKR